MGRLLKRVTYFFSNRWVLALVPALLVTWLSPDWFPGFRVSLVDYKISMDDGPVSYADLDSDGYSENIQTGDFTEIYRFVTIKDYDSKLINEWDFPGRGIDKERPYMTGDYDHNGFLEFYVVTCKADSLFVGTCEPLNGKNSGVKVRPLANSLPGLESYAYSFYPGKVTDLDGDGYGEAVFAITAGFCKQPRAVFAWDIRKDSILRSPLTVSAVSDPQFFDLLGDERGEILLNSYATGNCRKDEYPYHDSSSWLMVLDRHLQFCFEPLEFEGRAGQTLTVPYRIESKPALVLHRGITTAEHHRFELSLLSPEGKILFTRVFSEPVLHPLPFTLPDHGHERLFCLNHRSDKIAELNSRFDTIALFDIGYPSFEKDYTLFDIDDDGNTEVLVRVNNGNELAVLGNDMRKTALLPVAFNSNNPFFSVRKHGEKPATFVISDGNALFEYSYLKNPWHLLRFPWYLLVYAGSSYVILLVQYLGRLRLQRQIDMKNKITELQTLLLQNQLNPHFILNALNSVSASIILDRKEEAGEKMKHFTHLIRASLMDASRLERSLEQELSFVTHYMEVERVKMDHPFDYRLDIDPGVDITVEVPRMILHTFVENSIKHGLRPLMRQGLLTIGISNAGNDFLLIRIADNGVGRSRAMKTSSQSSTGKGQQIISELIDLHNAMKKRPITWEIHDLKDDTGNPAGTMVEVKMPVG